MPKPSDSDLINRPNKKSQAKAWAGLVTNADPHGLPASASPESFNAVSIVPGELRPRGGVSLVRFGSAHRASVGTPTTYVIGAGASASFLGRASQPNSILPKAASGRFSGNASASLTVLSGSPPSTSQFVDVEDEMGLDVTLHGVQANYIGTLGAPVRPDIGPQVQALLDLYVGKPMTFWFPPGTYTCETPIYVENDYHQFRGSGKEVTKIRAVNRRHPIFMVGFRRVELGGSTVTLADRPDAYGKLDTTMAPFTGAWRGYCTRGKTYAMSQGGPLTSGRIIHNRAMDSYGTFNQLCVEVAIDCPNGITDLGQNLSILGCGSIYVPAPFVMTRDSNGYIAVYFRTNDQGSDTVGSPRMFGFTPTSTGPGVHRFKFWIDMTSGTPLGIRHNGTDISSIVTNNVGTLTGKTLSKNRKKCPFNIGPNDKNTAGGYGAPDAVLPNYTILAFRISDIARKTDPGNDIGRYGSDSRTVGAFMGNDGEVARHLTITCSDLSSIPSTVAFIVPFTGSLGGVRGNSFKSMTLEGGSQAISIAQALHTTIYDCLFTDNWTSIGSFRTLTSYHLNIEDCDLSAYSEAFDFWFQIVRMRNVNMGGGIQCTGLAVGTDLTIDGSLIDSQVDLAETVFDLVGDETGGMYKISGVYVDNENTTTMSDSFVRCDVNQYGPITNLEVTNNKIFTLGTGIPLLNLRDPSPNSTWNGTDIPRPHGSYFGQITARNNSFGTDVDNACLLVKSTAKWVGVIDAKGYPFVGTLGNVSGITILT
jgi:hypothetical protein